jgi:cell division protein FtsN
MAKKRKAGRKQKKKQMPGWAWLLIGLAIGLSITAGNYVKERLGTHEALKKVADALPKPTNAEPINKDETIDWTFYTSLQLDTEFPDEDELSAPKEPLQTIEMPGTYLLQVGSYKKNKDADIMKAKLALIGISADIEKVNIERETYHRVLIGPTNNLKTLNRLRSQLQEMEIKSIAIQQ